MESAYKKEYILENLNCANCASKIEREVGNISGVISSRFDFVTKKLVLEVQSKEVLDSIYIDTKKIVNKYEPDVKVLEIKEASNRDKIKKHTIINKDNQKEAIRLLIGLCLYLLGMLASFNKYVKLGLFGVSYILVGGEVLLKAFKNIKRGLVFDENFLMSLATLGAFAIGQFPEGVSVMIFYQIGEFLQDLPVNNSRRSISNLMDLKSDYANLMQEGQIIKVQPEDVKVGDILIIKPGEKVPLDGVIIEGRSSLDTSALTGESKPRDVMETDHVLSGFININGLLKIEVEKEFSNSTASKILKLVESASSRKANTENFITKFARYYTPAVVIAALILAIVPPLFIKGAVFSDWIYRALIFLVVSCPCALVLSIPLSYFGGIGGAAKNGVLVKGGNYLEALTMVETVVFDKTGTLTKGTFKVVKINPANGIKEDEVIKYAAFAESFTNHPIALSILKAYGKKIDKDQIKEFEELPGLGIKARYGNEYIYVGNSKLLEKMGIEHEIIKDSGTVVYVGVNNKFAGSIIVADEVKNTSGAAISKLKEMGIKKTVMLTGDNKVIGESVASSLGIDEFYGELLPENKVEILEKLESDCRKNKKLAFVGDGINDAPVLARADIGIAMGGLGADAAIEAADVVIMNDDPYKIVTAINIAKGTKKIVWQNIIFALGVKAIVLILGAIGAASMWEAIFADVGVALIAVLNSMRVMRIREI